MALHQSLAEWSQWFWPAFANHLWRQESFVFKAQVPLQEKKGDQDLINHLYDFKIRVTGVKFESDEYWLMAQPGKAPSVARVRAPSDFPANAASRKTRKRDSAAGQDQAATAPILPINPAMKDGQPVSVRGALEFSFRL